MLHKKFSYSVLAVLLAAVWFVGMPLDAFAAAQKSPLVADGSGCNGAPVGKSKVKTLANGDVKVKVKFKSGPASDSGTVYWVCTNVANGCHNDACGFVAIGSISTDSAGKGVFLGTLSGGNPFPGSFVHLDAIMNVGGVFASVFPSVPLGSGGASGSAGDPTK